VSGSLFQREGCGIRTLFRHQTKRYLSGDNIKYACHSVILLNDPICGKRSPHVLPVCPSGLRLISSGLEQKPEFPGLQQGGLRISATTGKNPHPSGSEMLQKRRGNEQGYQDF
jgi:hypothetical protein